MAWPTVDFARCGIWISAGTQFAQSGTVVFSNSNNVTFGASRLDAFDVAITALASATTRLANFIQSISAGSAQVTSGQVVLSNSGGFSFGVNGQTITADFARISLFENGLNYDSIAVLGSSSGSASATSNLSYQRAIVWQPISATLANFLVAISDSASGQGTLTISFAVYTINGTSASLASSASSSISWTTGTNVSQSSVYAGIAGLRSQSVGLSTWVLTPGDYLFGFMASLNGAAGTTASMSVIGSVTNQTGVAQSVSGGNLPYFCQGYYSAGTSAFPGQVNASEVYNSFTATLSANASIGQPYFELVGTY